MTAESICTLFTFVRKKIRADPDSGNRRRAIIAKAPRQVKDDPLRIILQQENDHLIRDNHELRSQLEGYRLALHQEKGRNERLRHLLASDYNITSESASI